MFTKMDPLCILDFQGMAPPVIAPVPLKKGEVVIPLLPNQIKTKTHQSGSKTPIWNEKFTIPINFISISPTLQFKVLDEDVSEHDIIGESAPVSISEWCVGGNGTVKVGTYKLIFNQKDVDTINLEYKFTPEIKGKPDEAVKPPVEQPKVTLPPLAEPIKGSLELTVKGAILTRDTDMFTKMDPLCILDFQGLFPPVIPVVPLKKGEVAIPLLPNQIKTKTHQSGSKAPLWNEKFTIPINLTVPTPSVQFKVLDEDVTKHDLIGETTPVLVKDWCSQTGVVKTATYKLVFNSKEVGTVNVDYKFIAEP